MAGQKGNIFDHVLYEFEMYLYSFCEMQREMSGEKINQFRYNMAIDCHSVHIRNLIEFFNCDGKDCIDVNLILSGSHNYVISGELYDSLGVKQYVNKSVNHLSKDRYKWDGDATKDLAERQKKIPFVMFQQYIPVRIKAFLKQLIEQTDIKQEWIAMCNEPNIQNGIMELFDFLREFPDITY